MALVNLPDLPRLFSTVDWKLETPQMKNRSQWTGRTQVIGLPGAIYWTARAVVIPISTESAARKWRAFVASLRGAENTFLMPALPTPQAALPVEPIVTAAVAGNRQVDVNDASGIGVGMQVSILQTNGHYRLCVVVGKIANRISLEPELAGAPTIGSTVKVNNPVATMRLTSGSNGWSDASTVDFSLDMEEAL